ncbi:hypothetical protein F751_6264 [Auxenochlorella protothecoides]|uniref:Uncharacterized protein n=1 Tax=Auxenochlorella protothecoides TaxID=3075 RepID=A0A087SK59_AUXPR|nr:hypothetical protein F751_6264 [Auxenochlorella protothecoides]KFM26113.1 hypothetical protein F751_6264 [Auxenochlorella protothecoides]
MLCFWARRPRAGRRVTGLRSRRRPGRRQPARAQRAQRGGRGHWPPGHYDPGAGSRCRPGLKRTALEAG